MDAYDVVIAGGGPAGSSCAWKLRHSGLRIAILDKATFPRDKVCGGWITPAVLEELEIDCEEYSRGRVLQPITGFRTGGMDSGGVETQYGRPVSYGIRRYEFDDYLLRRCGARLLEGLPVTGLERSGGEWIINGQIRTPMLVGAGGTFCPVARFLGAKVNREVVVAAREAEFEMDERQRSGCAVRGETPELYFCSDLKGYGWCVRKQNVLNVGLGRLDRHGVARHATQFLEFLKAVGRLKFVVPSALFGHAYLLYGGTTRKVAGEGVVLIGDAAGMAYAQSGEGIRPAIESGLLAARAIASAQGCYSQKHLEIYSDLIDGRFGRPENDWLTCIGRRLPAGVISSIARRLLASPWFAREVVLNGWFLRQNEPGIRFS